MSLMCAKKTCKSCGNKVMIKRNENGQAKAPSECAMCKSLGVARAIQERIQIRAKSKANFEIKDGQQFNQFQKIKRMKKSQ